VCYPTSMIMSANLARRELASSSRLGLAFVGVTLLDLRGFLERLGLSGELDVGQGLASTFRELTKSSISSRRERLADKVADVMGRSSQRKLWKWLVIFMEESLGGTVVSCTSRQVRK
jgi:hypothetical protein